MQCIHTSDIVFVSIYLHIQIILLKVTEGFQISLKTTWKTKSGAIQFSPTYKLCTAILICDNMYQYVICLNFGQLQLISSIYVLSFWAEHSARSDTWSRIYIDVAPIRKGSHSHVLMILISGSEAPETEVQVLSCCFQRWFSSQTWFSGKFLALSVSQRDQDDSMP